MKKVLSFLSVFLLILTTSAVAKPNQHPVFHDVTVTSASGGPLTGSIGPVMSVKAKTLHFAGNMFESTIDGQTWLFNPERCVFTLPSGNRIIPVYGKDALGNTRWLLGIGPDSAVDYAGVAAGMIMDRYFQKGAQPWTYALVHGNKDYYRLQFPMTFAGEPDKTMKDGLYDAEYRVEAKARKVGDDTIEISDVTIRPQTSRETWQIEKDRIISEDAAKTAMRRAVESNGAVTIGYDMSDEAWVSAGKVGEKLSEK